jgi:hypothetical protein
MASLTVEARSLEGAHGLCSALSSFGPELSGSDENGYRVVVALRGSDRQVVAVLDAIEGYVSRRNDGPARLELDGRRYTLAARSARPHSRSKSRGPLGAADS